MTGVRRQDAKGSQAVRAVVLAIGLVGVAGAACTDPRIRPVPPTITFALPRQVVSSPGVLVGSVTVFDGNGLDSIHIRVDLGNGTSLGDSLFFASDDPFQTTLPLLWQLPPAVPPLTSVKLLVRARNYLGLFAADSVLTAVGDSLRQGI